MGTTFTLYKSYREKRFTTYHKVILTLIGTFMICFLFIQDFEDSLIFSIVLVVCLILVGVIRIRRFFTKVEHEKEVLGTLSVRVAYLDWNGEQIPWTEITSIAWQDQQIENTYRWTSGSKNLISPGINAIEFTTRRDKTYKGWYRLPNEQELLYC